MMSQVKICGVQTLDIALCALNTGADYIGFVFHPHSKRNISVEAASAIFKALNASQQAACIPVLVNQSLEEITELLSIIPFGNIQLQGPAARRYLPLLKPEMRCFFAINQGDINFENDLQYFEQHGRLTDFLLLDSAKPGSGQVADWKKLTRPNRAWFLAGGLNSDNALSAIEQCQPTGIDVSSGVESSPGIKDAFKIQQLLQQVKHV